MLYRMFNILLLTNFHVFIVYNNNVIVYIYIIYMCICNIIYNSLRRGVLNFFQVG